MYNLRYHVASLVAVFLALAVGLLLGTVVAERGMLTDQGKALVADLEKRFDDLNEANDELSQGLERDREFIADVEGMLVTGELSGTGVVIVAGEQGADELNDARDALEAAGAVVSVLTLRTPGAGLMSSEPEGLAGLLHGGGVDIAPAGEALEEQIGAIVAVELAGVSPRPTLELLAERGLLEYRSASETATADAIVAIAADDGPDPFALALAAATIERGARAAGAEAREDDETDDGSLAVACDDVGIPAIDHIDTPQGRISLVWVLSGRASGYFGSSDRADAYYPTLRLEE